MAVDCTLTVKSNYNIKTLIKCDFSIQIPRGRGCYAEPPLRHRRIQRPREAQHCRGRLLHYCRKVEHCEVERLQLQVRNVEMSVKVDVSGVDRQKCLVKVKMSLGYSAAARRVSSLQRWKSVIQKGRYVKSKSKKVTFFRLVELVEIQQESKKEMFFFSVKVNVASGNVGQKDKIVIIIMTIQTSFVIAYCLSIHEASVNISLK